MQNKKSKPPVIRRGNKVPFRKATNEQIESRIEMCAQWLGMNQCSRGEIVRRGRKKWKVDWRTVDIYISRARKAILKRANKTKADVFSEAVVFYEGVINAPKVKWSDRLKARVRLDEIFAIDPPKVVHQRVANETDKPFKVEEVNKQPLKEVPTEVLMRLLANLPAEPVPVRNGTNGHAG